MSDISNKVLVALIAVSIGISMYSIIAPEDAKVALTGRYIDTGVAQLTVTPVTAIQFTDAAINWGIGYVNESSTNCTLDSQGTIGSGCVNFTTQSNGFAIENIGNYNVRLELATGKNASQFIGGTSPLYQFKMNEREFGSCKSTLSPTVYTNVNITSPGTVVCTNFSAVDLNDALDIDVKVIIPSDVPAGAKSDTFTATATAVGPAA